MQICTLMLIKHNSVSTERCYATQNMISPLSLRHSKKRRPSCSGFWQSFVVSVRNLCLRDFHDFQHKICLGFRNFSSKLFSHYLMSCDSCIMRPVNAIKMLCLSHLQFQLVTCEWKRTKVVDGELKGRKGKAPNKAVDVDRMRRGPRRRGRKMF